MGNTLPVISVDYVRQLTRPSHRLDVKSLSAALEGAAPVRAAFCQAIENWSEENLRALLLWVTGSSMVPIGGFTNAPAFHVRASRRVSPGSYPVACTCSRQLNVSQYLLDHPETLEERLRLSIQQMEFTRD